MVTKCWPFAVPSVDLFRLEKVLLGSTRRTSAEYCWPPAMAAASSAEIDLVALPRIVIGDAIKIPRAHPPAQRTRTRTCRRRFLR